MTILTFDHKGMASTLAVCAAIVLAAPALAQEDAPASNAEACGEDARAFLDAVQAGEAGELAAAAGEGEEAEPAGAADTQHAAILSARQAMGMAQAGEARTCRDFLAEAEAAFAPAD